MTENQPARIPIALGELYADTGQKDKAQKELNKANRVFKEMGMTGYWLARTEKALDGLEA